MAETLDVETQQPARPPRPDPRAARQDLSVREILEEVWRVLPCVAPQHVVQWSVNAGKIGEGCEGLRAGFDCPLPSGAFAWYRHGRRTPASQTHGPKEMAKRARQAKRRPASGVMAEASDGKG